MGRPFRLGDEDRPEYASALDEVIASPEIQRLLERTGVPGDRLRVRGLAAVARVSRTAEAEYRRYAALRRQAAGGARGAEASPLSGPGDQERQGAGVLAVLGVLTPVLAAVAAATFLVLGYGLRLAGALPALADTLVGVGWLSLGIAAVAALAGVAALYRTAAKQAAADAAPAVPDASLPPALDRAREVWLEALRHRGIRPFLLQELAGPAAPGPDAGDAGSRFSSPAFAGPDFSGPGFGGSGGNASRPPAPGRS